jgi:hypothetical protein
VIPQEYHTMPPAAHPLLDLFASDVFLADMALRSSSASSSSSPKQSNSVYEMENLPLIIVQKTIPIDRRDERTLNERDQILPSIAGSPFNDIDSSLRYPANIIGGVNSTRNTTASSGAPKNSTSKNTKRVSFEDTSPVQVFETIHMFDYTVDELSSSFYSAKEMRDFQQERRELARMLDQGMSPEDIFETTGCDVRGIESATHNGNRHRRGHISDCIRCVMMEQELQYEDCYWNPDFIAHMYRRVCEESLREARKRGLNDEEEVLEDLESVRNVYKTFANQVATAPLWLPEDIPFGLVTYKL